MASVRWPSYLRIFTSVPLPTIPRYVLTRCWNLYFLFQFVLYIFLFSFFLSVVVNSDAHKLVQNYTDWWQTHVCKRLSGAMRRSDVNAMNKRQYRYVVGLFDVNEEWGEIRNLQYSQILSYFAVTRFAQFHTQLAGIKPISRKSLVILGKHVKLNAQFLSIFS